MIVQSESDPSRPSMWEISCIAEYENRSNRWIRILSPLDKIVTQDFAGCVSCSSIGSWLLRQESGCFGASYTIK
jgi:hypothetical protein